MVRSVEVTIDERKKLRLREVFLIRTE